MQAENEIVHIQQIHSTTFEIFHQDFSNKKRVILIAKGNCSSYNIISQIYLGKSPLLHLTLLYLYKTTKLLGFPLGGLWAPPVTFGLPPNCLISQFCLLVSAYDLYNMLHFRLIFKSTL